MKKIFSIIVVVFLCKVSNAQMIKTFDCITAQEDSSSTTYSLKVKFDSVGDKDKRLSLVKTELEEKHQIKPAQIIAIEAFMDKRPRTYRYRVRVSKK